MEGNKGCPSKNYSIVKVQHPPYSPNAILSASTGDQITYTFQGQSYGAIVVDPENQILWDMRTRSKIAWDEIKNMVNALYKLNSQGSFDIVPGINENWQELPQALGPVNSDDLVGGNEMLKIYSTNIQAACDVMCVIGTGSQIAGLGLIFYDPPAGKLAYQVFGWLVEITGTASQIHSLEVNYTTSYEITTYTSTPIWGGSTP